MNTKTKNIDKLKEEIKKILNIKDTCNDVITCTWHEDRASEILNLFFSRLGELRASIRELTETGGGYDATMEAEYAEAINDVLSLIDTLIPKEEL